MSFEEKSPAIQEAIKQAANNPDAFDCTKAPSCAWCSSAVDMKDFKDALSLKEFNISKMCQKCQDSFFIDD